jgi:hypothetical protein
MAWMKVTKTLQGNENPADFLLALLWTPWMRLAVVATVLVRVPKSPETTIKYVVAGSRWLLFLCHPAIEFRMQI